MLRILTVLYIIFSSYNVEAGGIRGKISTTDKQPLSYASVSVVGTGNGTMANEEGIYDFSLAPGNYDITFQFLGFKSVTKQVTISNDYIYLDVELEEQPLNLQEASVGSGKEDPAYSIMRKAIAKARFHQLQIRGYTAKVYSRSTALPTKIPFLVQKRLKKEGVQEGKSILNESVAEVKFRRPNSYSQHVISTRNSLDNSIPSPNEYILASLYSPEIAGTVTPLSPKAFSYYRFEYEGFFEDHGLTINKIKVIPKAYGEGVFKGSIYIIEDRWAIHSCDLQTTASGLNITAKQIFKPIQNVWLPVNQQFRINGSYVGFAGEFKYLVSLTYQKLDVDPGLREDIVINDHKKTEATASTKTNKKKNLDKLIQEQKEFSTKNFRKLTKQYEKKDKEIAKNDRLVRQDSIVIDPLANKRDTSYWEQLRPVPLSVSEVKGYALQDSLKVDKEIKNKKDRPDSTNFKLSHLATGNTYWLGNQYTFYFKSPLLCLSYNAVEGNSLNLITEWQKKWGKSNYLKLNPLLRYAFGQKRFYGSVEASIGDKNRNFTLSGGELASQFNRENPILPFPNSIAGRFFDRSLMKLYQQKYVRAEYNQRNIGDILGFDIALEYEKRTELFNAPTSHPIFLWRRFDYTPNTPVSNEMANTSFPQHTAFILDATVRLSPWRRYLIRNGEKRYLRSRGPSFAVNYKSGLPVAGDVEYGMLQGTIRQSLSLGPRSNLDYNVNGGGFLYKGKMYFRDYRHFMGNEFFFLWGDTPSHFKMLPYYKYSTAEWFVQAHATLSLQHFLVTRIEALRVTGLSENLQLHYLKAPTAPNYSELVYGIANIYRILKLEAVAQFHDQKFQKMGFRVGTNIRIGR